MNETATTYDFADAFFIEDAWPGVLEALAQRCEVDGITMVLGASARASVRGSTSMATFVAEYVDKWYAIDKRESQVNPTLQQGFVTDLDTFTLEQIAVDPFYQEYLKPRGYGWHAAAALAEEPFPIVISLKRTLQRGMFDAATVLKLNALLPGLRAAARNAVAAWHGAIAGHLESLERVRRGALVIDRRYRVLAHNESMQWGDGLSFDVTGKDGGLRASNPRDQQAMLEAIATAFDNPAKVPLPVVIHRPSGKRPLLLEMLGKQQTQDRILPGAWLMIAVNDLDRRMVPTPEFMQHAFALTPKEAALAAQLMAGAPLEEIAASLHITPGHARQRLQAIFKKTGTRRQAELVAVLARLS